MTDGAAEATDRSKDIDARCAKVQETMEAQPFFQGWSTLMLSSQDLLWHHVGTIVDPQLAPMEEAYEKLAAERAPIPARSNQPIPDYLAQADTHRMPGAYTHERDGRDVHAGAMYDLFGVIYQFGIGNSTGQLLNDSRGRTLVSHLRAYYPDFSPETILDMGCGAGNNTVPLCDGFPEAKVTGIDIGAGMVRYAMVRTAGLGRRAEYRQDNAEHTGFEDGSFDLVVSQIVLHETSPEATEAIFAESFRLARPGGVVAHLEVPLRYDGSDAFQQFFSSWEEHYNGEANIQGVGHHDLTGLARRVGLQNVIAGFQPMPPPGPDIAGKPLWEESQGRRGPSWYIVSGRKP
jgi:SAM-dependent methyltransferase